MAENDQKYINYVDENDQKRLLDKLLKVWRVVPGWRLCQLISNLHGAGPQDIFHTYDNQLEAGLDDFLKDQQEQAAGPAQEVSGASDDESATEPDVA